MSDNMSIRNIVFDLGRVLINWQPYEYISNKFGKESAEFLDKHLFNSLEWNLMDKGKLTEDQLWDIFVERFPHYSTVIQDLKYNVTSLLVEIKENTRLLRPLKDFGFKLYVLSNFSNGNFDYVVKRFDFFNYFDGMVISSHVGQIKPDKEIYETFIKIYKLDPKQSLFIDDKRENIQTAKELGFHVIHLTDHSLLKSELEEKLSIKIEAHKFFRVYGSSK
ncbi:MAG: HAD family hydrolase [Fervidobacterium sp.]